MFKSLYIVQSNLFFAVHYLQFSLEKGFFNFSVRFHAKYSKGNVILAAFSDNGRCCRSSMQCRYQILILAFFGCGLYVLCDYSKVNVIYSYLNGCCNFYEIMVSEYKSICCRSVQLHNFCLHYRV